MIVSREHRFLFIHVQKTGGSAVSRALGETAGDLRPVAGAKHATLGTALERFPEMRDYFAMGFVRNPWERFFSWHSMVIRRRDAAQAGTYDAARYARNDFWVRIAREYPDFESFIMEGTRKVRRLGVPQIDYLTTSQRRADFIGRTERLEADLARGLQLAGLPVPANLLQSNAGTGADYRTHYSPAMRDRVAEVSARDIEEFGYSFSG